MNRQEGPELGLLARLIEAQRRDPRNHVSEETIETIATELGVSVGLARGVTTFYSMLSEHPRGRHIVRVCESPPCRLAGGQDLLDLLVDRLGVRPGETTEDGEFTLELSSCLGACDGGPSMMIDDQLISGVRGEDVDRLLDEARRTEWLDARRELPSILGAPLRLLGGISESGGPGIPPDAYRGLRRAVSDLAPDDVVEMVRSAGLRGRGGAGFPTARKWEFANAAAGIDCVIICNADEGEPGTFKDRLLLEGTPHAVLEGMAIAGYAVGASRGILYVRGEYAAAAECIRDALVEARRAGALGASVFESPFSFDIDVVLGAGAYVCGEETSLIESAEGKRGAPRLRPPYPAEVGFLGRPTVVNNVETLANLPIILREGAEAYREFGTSTSPGTKLYSLCGSVAHPGVAEAEMGIPLGRLIDDFGGGVRDGRRFLAALVGGAAGTFVDASMLDVPLAFDELAARGGVLGSGAVLVLDDACDPAGLLSDLFAFFAHESCGRCVPCRIGTAVLQEGIGRIAAGEGRPGELHVLLETAKQMQATSLCPLGQSCYPLLESAVRLFRPRLLAEGGPR